MNGKVSLGCFVLLLVASFSGTAHAAEYAFLVDLTQISFLPSTIHSGDVVTMALDIHNQGYTLPIIDLNARLDSSDQLELLSLPPIVNKIEPGVSKRILFQFKVKPSTPAGYYPVFVQFEYFRDGKLSKQTETISVPVERSLQNISLMVSPNVISPATPTAVTFSLQNNNNLPVSNVTLSWAEASGLLLPLGSDNKRYISLLDSQQTATVSYEIAADPNITTGLYSLAVTLSFVDNNGTQIQTSNVGILVGGETSFEASVDSVASGQLSVNVANIGANNAGAVVVKIPVQNGVVVSGSRSYVIGNLNKGDFSLATFQTILAADQNGTTTSGTTRPIGIGTIPDRNANSGFNRVPPENLKVIIEYTDTTGQRQSVEKEVAYPTSAASGFSTAGLANRNAANTTNWIPLLIGLVTALVILMGFNHFKAKQEWNHVLLPAILVIIIFGIDWFVFKGELVATIVSFFISIGLIVYLLKTNPERGSA